MIWSGGPIRAVLFDCDGVLVDSEGLSVALFRTDMAQRGLVLSEAEASEIFIGGTMEHTARQAAMRGASLPDDWVDQFYTLMFAALAEEVEAIAGVEALLQTLADAGLACAVGSNGPYAKMEITLKRTGLWDRFDPHIYSARALGRPKPAPDIYLHAARQIGVAPAACVVIEDSPSGARAAQAAGMRCIGYATAGQDAVLAPHCDIVIGDMKEVAALLGLQS